MGQGEIEYRGQLMVNCGEGYSRYIGYRLGELSTDCRYRPLAPIAAHWMEALEAAPGSSLINLDSVIQDTSMQRLFLEALREIYANLLATPASREDLQARSLSEQTLHQIILFVELGERALEPVHKPMRPAGRDAT
jgi:hypothetical protein